MPLPLTINTLIRQTTARQSRRRPYSSLACASNTILSRQHHQYQQQQRFIWAVDSDTGIVSYKKEPKFQTIIGLEIHAQLDIATKLFSAAPSAAATTSAAPNTLVHPFDLAVPGVLPSTSQSAVQAAVLTAASLQCDIAPVSRFERKHYHYADLPFGYQVTQQRWPMARNGTIIATAHQSNSKKKKKKKNTTTPEQQPVRIDRIQLEQDTGKTTTSASRSLVDFNRAGCALVEIVMHPDIRSSSHAAATVETLRQLLKHIGTCNGKMEEGSLRVDLNVSIHPLDNDNNEFQSNLKNRVEVKNLNSLRQVQQAADFEAVRQAEIVAGEDDTTGGSNSNTPKTFQETRTFHVKSGRTVLIRSKEGDEDYRFMPEPDLPPVRLDEVLEGLSLEDFLAKYLPELPEAARERLQNDYNLDAYTATVISGDPPAIQLYDEAVQSARDHLRSLQSSLSKDKQIWDKDDVPHAVANLLCNELFSLIREREEQLRVLEDTTAAITTEKDTSYSTVNGEQLGEVAALQLNGTISTTMSRKLLGVLHQEYEEHGHQTPVSNVAQRHGLQLIADATALQALCRETILEKHPECLEQYKQGGKHVMKMKKFLVGKAMAHSRGNAHPERLHEVLEEVLEDLAPGVE